MKLDKLVAKYGKEQSDPKVARLSSQVAAMEVRCLWLKLHSITCSLMCIATGYYRVMSLLHILLYLSVPIDLEHCHRVHSPALLCIVHKNARIASPPH